MPRLLAALTAIAAVLAATGAPAGSATNDPYRSLQWGLDKVRAEGAWTRATGAGAVIAIVDTGVDLTHPDLDAKVPASAFTSGDFVEPRGECSVKGGVKRCTQDGARDENGHGTHVAGIAAAETGNGTGVAGTAPGASLLPVRVLDEEGSGSTDQVAAGVRYAADRGADVINLSLGMPSGVGTAVKIIGDLAPLYKAVDYAWSKGAVVVIAAGNDSVPLCSEPSAHPRAVCVGATDQNDLPSWFSNTDATMTSTFLMAPGGNAITCKGDILSTYRRSAEHSVCSPASGYEALPGTSMAAPFV